MLLSAYVLRYEQANDIARATVDYLRYSVRALEVWHGSPLLLQDLTPDLLNRWEVS